MYLCIIIFDAKLLYILKHIYINHTQVQFKRLMNKYSLASISNVVYNLLTLESHIDNHPTYSLSIALIYHRYRNISIISYFALSRSCAKHSPIILVPVSISSKDTLDRPNRNVFPPLSSNEKMSPGIKITFLS